MRWGYVRRPVADYSSDLKAKLTVAFRALRRAGYFARQRWQCCMSCGFAAVPEGKDKVVFYHAQDSQRMYEGAVYLAWAGNGTEIKAALEAAGLAVIWNSTEDQRILAALPEVAYKFCETA